MQDILPDLCDKYEGHVLLWDIPLQNFGGKSAFFGEIVTVRCFHDNSKVIEAVSKPGQGKVLVVDGNGSTQRALLGDQVAQKAIDNGWEGIIINGAVRDVGELSEMPIGIKAIGTCPFKTEKRNIGEVNVSLMINRFSVHPGDYIYADWNGVLVSSEALEVVT
jgi:regulator of ribonuclease activity A